MTTAIDEKGYRSTESTYKSGAHEMCVTYDLEQKSHGSRIATYPKVKRVYIAGKLKDWKAGVRNKLGREVHGVRIAAARNVHCITTIPNCRRNTGRRCSGSDRPVCAI
jgi:hypothetical protein